MTKETNDHELAKLLSEHYEPQLDEGAATEAAHNLVGLFEVLLEIHQEGVQGHATC